MTFSSSLRVLLASAGVAMVALTASGAAQAQNNVYWSVGMSAPGMQVGVANAPPVAIYPQVAYPQAYPQVYAAPRPVGYYGNNGYYAQPAPVYYAPQPVWQPRLGYGRQIGYGYGYREQERFAHGRGGWGGGHGGGYRH